MNQIEELRKLIIELLTEARETNKKYTLGHSAQGYLNMKIDLLNVFNVALSKSIN